MTTAARGVAIRRQVFRMGSLLKRANRYTVTRPAISRRRRRPDRRRVCSLGKRIKARSVTTYTTRHRRGYLVCRSRSI